MTAIAKLRAIGKFANEGPNNGPVVLSLIDDWIKAYVIEVGHGTHFSDKMRLSDAERLEYENERTVQSMAANIVSKYSTVTQHRDPIGLGYVVDRKILVIKESE